MSRGAARSTAPAPGAGGSTALWKHEARALLPFWAMGVLSASVALLTSAAVWGHPRPPGMGTLHRLSLVGCIAATIVLGAQSIGHEYAHRTLGLLLARPIGRRRMLLTKLAVAALMALPFPVLLSLPGLFRPSAIPWLSAAAALSLAPALTMMCRGPLAGAVFSAALPGLLFPIVSIVCTPFDGTLEAERAALRIWSWLMIPLLAAAAVLTWRLFMRLEAIDEGGGALHRTWWTRPPRVAPSHPLWLLVKKELRLQQMAFALTAIYAAAAAAVAFFGPSLQGDPVVTPIIRAASSVYWLCVPVLVGSLATAEERQFGTMAWQLRLPTPLWQQWIIKTCTAFAVALVLAIVVPMLLARVLWPAQGLNPGVALVVTLLTTAASLYVSSLSTSAVQAALTSLAAVPLGLWLVVTAVTLTGARIEPAFWAGRVGAGLGLMLLVVATLLGFAFVNHRPQPPVRDQVRRQLLSIAALWGVGALVLTTVRF